MIIAKPVIDKQFWVLQRDNEKIGNVEACDGGYQLKIDNKIEQYKSIKLLEKRGDIVFEQTKKITKSKATDVYGFVPVGKFYNPTWDVQHKLPLYTKTLKSKSWIAAGWYQLKQGRCWEVVQDPKLILLERYPYKGPYFTKEEAEL
jgi:hypothetical protein